MKLRLLFWSFILLLFSCDEPSHFPLEHLAGKWESVSDKSSHYEEWELNGTGELSGKGYVITSGDTIFIEKLSIEKIDGVNYYTAIVPGKNSMVEVSFEQVECDHDEIVFENADNSFPQRIIYSIPGDGRLNARIEGYDNGQFKEVRFRYRKSE